MSTPRVLLIDNYDSFTWNLAHLLETAGAVVAVVRNDAVTDLEVAGSAATHLVFSPGPGRPEAAGCTISLIRDQTGRLPILGVCLGHQAIAAASGAVIEELEAPVHGKTSAVDHRNEALFRGLPRPVRVARYHSLVVKRESVPDEFVVDAWIADDESIVMGLRHRRAPVFGVQFHPESFLTEASTRFIAAFLETRP